MTEILARHGPGPLVLKPDMAHDAFHGHFAPLAHDGPQQPAQAFAPAAHPVLVQALAHGGQGFVYKLFHQCFRD